VALNPACTPGWAIRLPEEDHFIACCGCGWEEPGFPSRSSALRAQKDHRFPPTKETHDHRHPAA
jgi:hypothetical protein